MYQVKFNTGQAVSWCLSTIKNEAATQKRKYMRWERDSLTLNSLTEEGEERGEIIPSSDAEQAFHECELALWLKALPDMQAAVLYDLYILDETEQEVANEFCISRQKVNRLKHRALSTLRKEMLG